MRSRRTNLRAGLVALLVALPMAAAGGSSAASAAEPSLRIRAEGAVVARGTGIAVDLVLTCFNLEQISVFAAATQRQADGTVLGAGGSRRVSCTGAQQVVRMVIPASTAPFRPGVAFVHAASEGCESTAGCQPMSGSRTVQIPAKVMDAAGFTGNEFRGTLPSSATLEPGGAGVTVRVPYRCPAGFTGFLVGGLVQRTSTGIVTNNYVQPDVMCTGAKRSGVVTFEARAAGYRPGKALLVLEGWLREAPPYGTAAYAYRTLTIA